MAYRRIETALVGLLLVLSVLCTEESAAQSSCSNVFITMSPCLSYISGNSPNPSSECCSQLANVVRLSPQCLCEVLNGSSLSLGGKVNQTRTLALPDACNVQTPIGSCNGGSPADSPSGSLESPGEGRGSGTVPTSQRHSSSRGSSTVKQPHNILSFFLFGASFVSMFITH